MLEKNIKIHVSGGGGSCSNIVIVVAAIVTAGLELILSIYIYHISTGLEQTVPRPHHATASMKMDLKLNYELH
jgi:hypothetical protein